MIEKNPQTLEHHFQIHNSVENFGAMLLCHCRWAIKNRRILWIENR